ncbi:MAG: hypothetical protein GY943_02895 [Chloroflexi bacterium]|nr:hypothetical protein [Chloroflexota bacterium]
MKIAMRSRLFKICLLFVVIGLCSTTDLPVLAQETDEPVVQAVLFYSPTCPHCHEVINNFLIPLMEEYGDQLEVLGIDVTTEAGSYLYNNAIAFYEIPENRLGVPALIYEDIHLVGSSEIPNQFPDLLEAGLTKGGVGWPDIPELAAVVVDLSPSANPEQAMVEEPTAVPSTPEAEVVIVEVETAVAAVPDPEDTAARSLAEIDAAAINVTETTPPQDPVGFAIGWLVVLGLMVVVVFAVQQIVAQWQKFAQLKSGLSTINRSVLLGVLVIVGLIVSGYLAYVETMQVTAVCGPVGECNIVQSSPYARFLNVPIAVWGIIFYLTVVGLWALQQAGKFRQLAIRALVGTAILGTLFSIYLTLLELLVIGAVCAWCLTSAVVTGLILLLIVSGVMNNRLV